MRNTWGDVLVVFHPSQFEEFEEDWNHVATAFGGLKDLEAFFRACDGFSDKRYTSIHSIENFVTRAKLALEESNEHHSVWFGDGNGMDEKHLTFLTGDWFEDGKERYCFTDYDLGCGEEVGPLRAVVCEHRRAHFNEFSQTSRQTNMDW